MNRKVHMQHDQPAGHQIDKIQPGQESKLASDSKNSKTNKPTLNPEWLGVCSSSGTLMFRNIKTKEKYIEELGHNDFKNLR